MHVVTGVSCTDPCLNQVAAATQIRGADTGCNASNLQWILKAHTLKLPFTRSCCGVPQFVILLTVNPLTVGYSISVISVNGWHELFEPHSYRCNTD